MSRRAYTLVELLVVIVIGAILVGIAVPSFQALLASSRESLAQNGLQQAIYSARDMATRNLGGGDAAAVFFYDRNRGLTVGVYEQIGSVSDDSSNDDSDTAQRDVFVPIAGMEAVGLPPGYMIRGFVLGTQLRDEDWYEELTEYDPSSGTLQPGGPSERGPGAWVFPETDFYDQTAQDDGADRQTFMIRFEAGTGALSRESATALVLDPRLSGENRALVGSIEPINQAEDLKSWAVRAVNTQSVSPDERSELIGNESSDTVLARPVTDIALYRERRMAQMLGLRGLNRQTDTIYEPDDQPEIDSALFRDATLASDRVALETRITQWIEGRLALEDNDAAGTAAEADSAIYTISAYFGDLVEVNR
ncbi:MAG: prepilin-type N-terminal cleavage/methylation domain-containing protein [Phycisphaera sp.]|nr:MAG: prepilin-type N-terminal cleavage/methylation domain-containing protein [Phycisphaera sp.]